MSNTYLSFYIKKIFYVYGCLHVSMCTTYMQYPWRPKEGRADRHVEKKRGQTVSLEFGQRRDCVATGLD